MAITIGTPGDDVLQPGPGEHTALLLNGNDRFVWNPGDGNDFVDGRHGTDTLVFNGADAPEVFTVSDSADGGHGNDLITGGAGQDFLSGGTGSDILDGGLEDDLLLGGADADRFKFTGTDFGDNAIGDWEREDILLLDQAQLANGTPVTEVGQIDTNADGLLNKDDDSFDVVDGDLVMTLQGGSAFVAGFHQIGANVEIA